MNKNVIITDKRSFLYLLRRTIQKVAYRLFGPIIMTRIYYRMVIGRKLNLDNPKLFSEKICWYKLFYCPTDNVIIQCSDKYSLPFYLESKGLAQYQIKLIGSWNNPEEIDWQILPGKFALKCSHGCGYNIICLNKQDLDEKYAKRLLKLWQKDNFGHYNAEPHYDKGVRKIICEEYIDSDSKLPIDYKFHCIHGEPKFVLACYDREKGEPQLMFYDIIGQPVDYGKLVDSEPLKLDYEMFAKMVNISRVIAKDFPFVRVDFYVHRNELRIGELTFTPAAGLIGYLSEKGDAEIGKLFDIDGLKNKE